MTGDGSVIWIGPSLLAALRAKADPTPVDVYVAAILSRLVTDDADEAIAMMEADGLAFNAVDPH